MQILNSYFDYTRYVQIFNIYINISQERNKENAIVVSENKETIIEKKKSQEDYHGSKNRMFTKRYETLHN